MRENAAGSPAVGEEVLRVLGELEEKARLQGAGLRVHVLVDRVGDVLHSRGENCQEAWAPCSACGWDSWHEVEDRCQGEWSVRKTKRLASSLRAEDFCGECQWDALEVTTEDEVGLDNLGELPKAQALLEGLNRLEAIKEGRATLEDVLLFSVDDLACVGWVAKEHFAWEVSPIRVALTRETRKHIDEVDLAVLGGRPVKWSLLRAHTTNDEDLASQLLRAHLEGRSVGMVPTALLGRPGPKHITAERLDLVEALSAEVLEVLGVLGDEHPGTGLAELGEVAEALTQGSGA
jgi:hypothetical protein